jgi:hypothetical protein
MKFVRSSGVPLALSTVTQDSGNFFGEIRLYMLKMVSLFLGGMVAFRGQFDLKSNYVTHLQWLVHD